MGDFEQFMECVNKKTGIDLSLYKEKQMKRRLSSLKEKRGCHSFADYYTLIVDNREYFNEFLDRITINVSEFYRNKKRWDILDQKIIPNLLSRKKRLKIWSAACSTGEEPYTIAMILSQHTSLSNIDILATDLDENALNVAKKGVYLNKSVKEVPSDIKQKFFTESNDVYTIDPALKRVITFKKHNLLKDTYSEGFDLIVCRNVLIYFTEKAKGEIYQKFSHALDDNGVLFVGSTEQIFNPKQYQLQTVDTFFYKKQN
ncbi:chemotaxis protein methyltransferase CheR [Salinibacillus kushneri]|uniref:protein-glutamate O-methyltransferase n=1 Tax=Salinibacillus kushneri TaxID=237682 RepID=A0A1I0I194_9BACI|nr:protein-glutamate O-methyltransferase CheR [Salinibacillus kushneri]SET90199.1 chemotaxis protein methyltransferase CheR [Salinibacillus kushneri]